MQSEKILVINCGSSSIKYKVFRMPEENILASGLMEKIGEENSHIKHQVPGKIFEVNIIIKNHIEGLEIISKYLRDKNLGVVENVKEITGVGHRVVHGGEGFNRSVIITEEVLKKIEEYKNLAPLHNPHNLAGIMASRKLFSGSTQVAAFDTAFHTTIPPVAYLYGLPYCLYKDSSIRRYGFHGTSHRYVSRRSAELMGKDKYRVNVITCHLGNGCSITAVKDGHSIDTSMGFTPLEGLIMGTRSGDIDPGIMFYLAEKMNLDFKQLNNLLNKESGLLGLSGISNDFRDISREIKKGNERAMLSLEVFCYRMKKYIGAYLAVLGKTDAVIFTAGIGENVPLVRKKSLENMENFGIILDEEKNNATIPKEREISRNNSPVKVFVIPTDEELRIAYDTYQFVLKREH
ncbi:MAG: acetate kinase [Candidatus Omnitrophica bacterium]|nr:acetate kinase [Candidatus Omnitrophota bacterium]